MKPLAVDLFTGLHGWAEGLTSAGFEVIGFDIEDMCGQFGIPRPDGVQLVLQDVLTIHGKQFKDVDLIVASPPCQEFSYMAMPWSRAKQIAYEYRTGIRDVKKLTALFDACFRIQREACEAAGRHIPMVVENVRGTQEWVGRSRWAYGSFHLWGDVPALMPIGAKQRQRDDIKNTGGSWFAVAHNTTSGKGKNPDGRCGHVGPMRNDPRYSDGIKQGGDWFNKASGKSISRRCSSKSKARKRASAIIAKIPFALSSYIARHYLPQQVAA